MTRTVSLSSRARSLLRLVLAVWAAALAAFTLAPAPADAYPLWDISALGGYVNGSTALVLDAGGQPHLAYATLRSLKVAEWDGSAWQTTTIASSCAYESNDISLALRPDDSMAAVSFYDICTETVRVGIGNHIAGGWSWIVESLPAYTNNQYEGDTEVHSSAVTIDANGIVHLIFNEDVNVYYARRQGSWLLQEITDSAHHTFWDDMSVALDSNGKVHASFDNGTSRLTYARQTGAFTWALEDVATAAGSGNSLGLTGADMARIAFHDSATRSLKYATRNPDYTWTVTTVETPAADDPLGDAGQFPSLVLDSAGNPHISYKYAYKYDDQEAAVKYAVWDGAAWQIEWVESERWAQHTSLALGGAGEANISYTMYAMPGGPQLHYAKRTEGSGAPPAVPDTFIDSTPPRLTNQSAPFTFHSDDPAATFQCRNNTQSWMACTSPHSSAYDGSGTYTFLVRAINAAGTDPSPAYYTWTYDNITPNSHITSGPARPSSSPDATFEFWVIDDSPVTFRCRVVPQVYVPGDIWPDFQPCTSPSSFTGIDDGDWVFELMATDAAGNAETYFDAAFYWWTIDLPGPATVITGHPPAQTNSTTASFAFTSDDAAATFQCSLDGATFAACTSPASYTVSQDAHTFRVRAVAGGLTDPIPAAYTWKVDTTPPTAAIGDKPPLNDQLTTATFTFSSNDATATFECQLDGSGYTACATPKTYTGLATGNHTFHVRAVDPVGNVSPTPAHYTWYTAGPPQTSIYYPDPLPAYTTSSSISFLVASTKANSSYECRLDGGTFAVCTGGNGQSYTNLTPGRHTFSARAIDSYGQPDPTPAVHTWIIDPYWPDTRLDGRPANPSNSAAPRFLFSSGGPGATFECRLDGGGWSACANPKEYSGLSNGSHTFDVRATSGAGIVDPTPATYTWTIALSADTAPPDTTIITQPPNPANSNQATFTFTSDDPSATFECALPGTGVAPCTSPITVSGQYLKEQRFDVRARDDKGNLDPSPARVVWQIQYANDPAVLALSQYHACALRPDGSVDCWGNNSDGKATDQAGPFTAIAANDYATCGLRPNGSVKCWGKSNFGGTDQDGPFSQISGGAYSFCGVKADNSVACWGWNANGQADNQTGPYTLVSAGTSHTCALNVAGAITCWGSNSSGQLSPPAGAFYRLVSGYGHSCAMKADGSVDCWGFDGDGQNAYQPGPYTQLTAGQDHNCALRADGSADCWGRNDYGQAADQPGPYVTIAAGGHFTCALRADGSVDCWGHNPDGRADDQAGPFDPYVPDVFPPDTRIDSGPATSTEATDAAFTFRGNETGVTFACSLDGAAAAACASPYAYTGLTLGARTFVVTASDAAGNSDATPAQYAWTINAPQPPETTILTGPAALTNSASATFTFSSDEPGSSFQCTLDGAAFAACASPKSYSGLNDGSHTFEVKAIDSGGAADPTPAAHTWTIDTTAPETTLTGTPANPSDSSAASFTFSSEAGATFECKLDGSAYAVCTSPQSYSGLSDGSHTFQVRAKDAVGNVDPTPASHDWTLDATPPDTTLTGQPAATTTSTSATFTFTGVDAASFECKLDAAAFIACVSPHTYTGLVSGSHTFQVRAKDSEGRYDPTPAAYTWTIDTAAPETTITTKPTDPSNDATPDFAFSSDDPNAYFYCQTDANGWFPCGGSSITYYNLFEGDHTFYVKAEDALGNVDPTPATWHWTMDLTAPETTLTGKPAAVATGEATFTFASTEDGTFECKLDSAAFAACTTPKSYTGLADGNHTFQVRARDAATNVDATPAAYTWTVDATPPDTTLTATPPNPSPSADAAFGFIGSDSGTGVALFECRLDSGAWATCASPKAYTGLSEGSHTFKVRAIDGAGNSDPTPAEHTWTIAVPQPPDTNLTVTPPALSNSATASFTFSSNQSGSTFECRLDSAPFDACTTPTSYTGLTDGSHTFQVRARNTSGQLDPTPASFAWTIDATAPSLTLDSKPSALTNVPTATFTFSSADAGATFGCRFNAGAWSACTSPKSYPNLADGGYTFDVRAQDAAGNTSSPLSHAWTVDTTPPQTTIAGGPPDPSTGADATFAFGSNEAGATFTCQLDGGTAVACASPTTYTGLTDGSHTFTVRATDAAGNADPSPAAQTWLINLTAPETTIDSAPAALTNSASAAFTFSSNEPGATFRCRLDAGQWADCASPAAYDSLAEGQHTFAVAATDGGGRADETPAGHVWTIDLTPPETTINSGPSGVTGDNDPSFTFSSEAGATFECRLDAADWAACDSPRGFTDLGDGNHTFHVRATDAAGNTGPTAERAFTVDASAPTVTIDTHPPALTNSNAPAFTFSSEVGATYACRLDGETFAACASPQQYTGLVDGEHTFTVRATDAAGNSGEAAYVWTIDTAPPNTTITLAPPNPSPSPDATFAFTGEAGATFDCRLDGGAWATCVSPLTATGLSEGSHTFEVRASDAAGNIGPAAGHTWTIDLPAPMAIYVTAAGGSVPGAGAYQKNDILKWDGSAWSVWFDGAAEGLPAAADIIAFDVADDDTGAAWIAIRQAVKLPGAGKVQPTQIAYTNGATTWALFFDGGDVGLKTTGERINGLEVLPGSVSPIGSGCQYYLLISTIAGGGVPIGGTNVNFTGEDVLGFCMTQSGTNTAGTWHIVFEGQSEGLQKNNNLGLSAADDAATLYFTVKSNFTGDGGLVRPSQLFSFSGGVFSGPLWRAADHGLTQIVDGIDVVGN